MQFKYALEIVYLYIKEIDVGMATAYQNTCLVYQWLLWHLIDYLLTGSNCLITRSGPCFRVARKTEDSISLTEIHWFLLEEKYIFLRLFNNTLISF